MRYKLVSKNIISKRVIYRSSDDYYLYDINGRCVTISRFGGSTLLQILYNGSYISSVDYCYFGSKRRFHVSYNGCIITLDGHSSGLTRITFETTNSMIYKKYANSCDVLEIDINTLIMHSGDVICYENIKILNYGYEMIPMVYTI